LIDMTTESRLRARVIAFAILGALAGGAVFQRAAGACSCAKEEWNVHLVSVSSSEIGTSHLAYWPTDGVLTSYPGAARIWATEAAPEAIDRAGASR
jgi:hypothetical protein